MDEKAPLDVERDHSSTDHEKTDAHVKPLFYFLGALTLLIVIALAISVGLFNLLESREAATDKSVSPLADPFSLPPEPRLDTTSQGDLQSVLTETRGKLEGYEWIDEEAGVVRIPIQRAMELTLEQGLPVRQPIAAEAAGDQ